MEKSTTSTLSQNYEPPVAKDGPNYELAPGVIGFANYKHRHGYDWIDIENIDAVHEGSGDVGRFLDSLSERCVISCVVSQRLKGMLLRRGWRETFPPEWKGLDVWVHE